MNRGMIRLSWAFGGLGVIVLFLYGYNGSAANGRIPALIAFSLVFGALCFGFVRLVAWVAAGFRK